MIEPQRDDDERTPDPNREAKTVIALGRLVYRFCTLSPELLAFDPATLWQVMFDSYADDGADRRLLASCKDTSAWPMAVLTARLMRDVYEAGGFDEEPA